jgi:pyruvate kinase
MVVTTATGERVKAECVRTSYLASGMELRRTGTLGGALRVGRLPALDRPIVLKKVDTLVLSNKLRLGRGPEVSEDGRVLRPATINCTIPEILRDIKAGRIWFDDGKIGGVIGNVADSDATIEITNAGDAGSVVINFVQAYRSEQAVRRLREQVAPTASVLRDGNWGYRAPSRDPAARNRV